MKASIILPAFEEQEYIEEALRSLRAQDRPVHELIVVDSHSQDLTTNIASKYANKVVQAGPGKLHARNVGAEAAEGDVLLWADADRRYPSDWAHNLLRHFDGDSDVVAVSGRNRRGIEDVASLGEHFIGAFVGPTASVLSGGYWLDGGSSATRKDAYERVGGLQEEYDDANIFKVWYEEELRFPKRLANHGEVLYDRTITCHHEPRRLQAFINPEEDSRYAQQVRSGERF